MLQEQEFERLGSTRTVRVDVRLVAATNRDLAQMAANGQFRSDLYYRLNVFPVVLPPLRERRDDIPRLVRHFAHKVARRMGRRIETIPAEAMDALVQYPWPGNIRELENVIERAVILSPGPALHINLGDLQGCGGAASKWLPLEDGSAIRPTAVTLADAERDHILGVLRETDWVLGRPERRGGPPGDETDHAAIENEEAGHLTAALVPVFRHVPKCRHIPLRQFSPYLEVIVPRAHSQVLGIALVTSVIEKPRLWHWLRFAESRQQKEVHHG